jgi:hypothetical protein
VAGSAQGVANGGANVAGRAGDKDLHDKEFIAAAAVLAGTCLNKALLAPRGRFKPAAWQ